MQTRQGRGFVLLISNFSNIFSTKTIRPLFPFPPKDNSLPRYFRTFAHPHILPHVEDVTVFFRLLQSGVKME